jgi:hypothetical protein
MPFIHVGAPHMIVADLGREEFQNALGRFRRGRKKLRLKVRRSCALWSHLTAARMRMPELENLNPYLFEACDHAIYRTRKSAK